MQVHRYLRYHREGRSTRMGGKKREVDKAFKMTYSRVELNAKVVEPVLILLLGFGG